MSEPTVETAPASDEAEAEEVRAPTLAGRTPFYLALESLIIVASVLLAFGLNEWRGERADRQLMRNVVEGLHTEISANLALIEEMQPMHARFAQSIADMPLEDAVGRPAFSLLMDHRPDGGSLVVPPAEAAWQTAVSTAALRLLDYETVAVLSRIYAAQHEAVGRTSERLADFVFSTQMFDPTLGPAAAQVILALMRELSSQEEYLMMEYREGLRRLEEIR